MRENKKEIERKRAKVLFNAPSRFSFSRAFALEIFPLCGIKWIHENNYALLLLLLFKKKKKQADMRRRRRERVYVSLRRSR